MAVHRILEIATNGHPKVALAAGIGTIGCLTGVVHAETRHDDTCPTLTGHGGMDICTCAVLQVALDVPCGGAERCTCAMSAGAAGGTLAVRYGGLSEAPR